MRGNLVEVGIALGSNLPSGVGNSTKTLNAAVEHIRSAEVTDVNVSRFFRTPAWPPGSGPEFVNAALSLRTSMAPRDILDLLHRLEADLGRIRRERWGPRAIDLDLLFHGDAVLPDQETYTHWQQLPPADQAKHAPDGLILPHPRLHERAFVLVPLADVAPTWRHPVLGQTVAAMADALSPDLLDGIQPIEDAR